MDAQYTHQTLEYSNRPHRPLWESLKRGWLGRCPECGEGRLFCKYLSLRDECPSCGMRIDRHQADDAPPYFTIFLVGHLLVPLMIGFELLFSPSLPTILAVGITTTIIFALTLLPRIKRALVGLQWAKYMHGFGEEPEAGAIQSF